MSITQYLQYLQFAHIGHHKLLLVPAQYSNKVLKVIANEFSFSFKRKNVLSLSFISASQWATAIGTCKWWIFLECASNCFSDFKVVKCSHCNLKVMSIRRNWMNSIGTSIFGSELGGQLLMLPPGGSWCHRCCLHSSSLCFGRGGVIGCVGRVLFCQGALFFSPCTMSPTSALRGFWPHTRGFSLYCYRYHLPPTSLSTFASPSFLSVFLFISFSFEACSDTARFH